MLGRKFRLGAAVAALALGAALGSTAVASAATAPSTAPTAINQTVLVLSDTITFSGVATPSTAGGGAYVLNSNNCTLTSDGETVVFPCTINLAFNLQTLTGMGHVTSADGVINWSLKLIPTGAVGNYSMMDTCSTGANVCYEIDSDGPASVMYPIAAVTGTVTIKPIPGTPNYQVSGKISIWETPNEP